jgi:2'-5' RNA ligase
MNVKKNHYSMRAFIAVDLSDGIKSRIKEIQNEFRDGDSDVPSQSGLRFVNARQAHITLKFLGNVPDAKVGEIKRALGEINQPSFDMELRGVGFFPEATVQKAKRIRVIWIGGRKGVGVEGLKALHQEVESKMAELGFQAERKFSTHVTLCRVKKMNREEIELVLKQIDRMREAEVGKMSVEEIKLKKSTLTPKGPIYEDVYVKRLGN